MNLYPLHFQFIFYCYSFSGKYYHAVNELKREGVSSSIYHLFTGS